MCRWLATAFLVLGLLSCDKAGNLRTSANHPVGKMISEPGVGATAAPAATLLPDGRGLVAYHNESTKQLEVVAESAPGSGDFSKVVSFDFDGHIIGKRSALTSTADGEVHLVYTDSTAGHLLYSHGAKGNPGGKPELIAIGKDQAKWDWVSVTAHENTLHVVAHVGNTLHYLRRLNGTWQRFWLGEQLDSESKIKMQLRSLGPYASIASGPSGKLYLAFYDNSSGDLFWAQAEPSSDAARGPEWQFSPLDTDGDVGTWPDIKIDSTGSPVIAYRDETNGDIKIVRPLSAEKAPRTILREGNTGMDLSLYLDKDNKAHVSFLAVDNFDLGYAHETGNGSDWTILDDKGMTGLSTNLLGVQGNSPHIIYLCYYDRNDQERKNCPAVKQWPGDQGSGAKKSSLP